MNSNSFNLNNNKMVFDLGYKLYQLSIMNYKKIRVISQIPNLPRHIRIQTQNERLVLPHVTLLLCYIYIYIERTST
jgi:hypothetical protein